MEVNTSPRVTVIGERRHYVPPPLPVRTPGRATRAGGAYTVIVLSLLTGTIALSIYDLYVLISLTVR